MFGLQFYSKDNSKENNDSDLFVITGENEPVENQELKQEYFNKWKDSINIEKNLSEAENCQYVTNCNFEKNECDGEKIEDDNEDDDEDDNEDYNEDEKKIKEDEKINDDDDDEDSVDKLYIISLDGVPYYYEHDLISARTKMWDIANNILKKDSVKDFENPNYIFTNNLNKVSLISPYNFFGLNYHHTICELQIDYVIRYNK